MYINGIGVVSGAGLDLESFIASLSSEAMGKPEGFLVDLSLVREKSLLKKMRRADKFSKMAVVAAAEALLDAQPEMGGGRVGIILTTAFGPHVTTFDFLDDIIEYGDRSVSPTTFSNSVHNAAASYIAVSCGIHGPTLTVTQFFSHFQQGMALASAWLSVGFVDKVLLGAVDVHGDVLGYVTKQKLTPAPGGLIDPFELVSPACVPGEGAAFFVLSMQAGEGSYCRVRDVSFADPTGRDDLVVIDSDGLLSDGTSYEGILRGESPVAAYCPVFGSTMAGSAFSMAAAAYMLKSQQLISSPVSGLDNGYNILRESNQSEVGSISCIRHDCFGAPAAIRLEKA